MVSASHHMSPCMKVCFNDLYYCSVADLIGSKSLHEIIYMILQAGNFLNSVSMIFDLGNLSLYQSLPLYFTPAPALARAPTRWTSVQSVQNHTKVSNHTQDSSRHFSAHYIEQGRPQMCSLFIWRRHPPRLKLDGEQELLEENSLYVSQIKAHLMHGFYPLGCLPDSSNHPLQITHVEPCVTSTLQRVHPINQDSDHSTIFPTILSPTRTHQNVIY